MVYSEVGIKIPHELRVVEEEVGGAERRSERAKNFFKRKEVEILKDHKPSGNNRECREEMELGGEVGFNVE